jgi:hypothetical protein
MHLATFDFDATGMFYGDAPNRLRKLGERFRLAKYSAGTRNPDT